MTNTNDQTSVFNPYKPLPPKERIRNYFADTLCEADEFITAGELNAGEVIDQFVEAMNESQKYFADKVKVYDMLRDAITSRYRNQ